MCISIYKKEVCIGIKFMTNDAGNRKNTYIDTEIDKILASLDTDELRAREGGIFRHMAELQQHSAGWAI